jgi:hypothetical protein
LSNTLLRNVGEFFHGHEWQAPLARDLHVNERTMRRWVAGTEAIPSGVWNDLGRNIEIYYQALGNLLGEVKRTSGLVEVHSFEVWDSRAGTTVRPERKSTADRIAKIKGEIIPGSAEWVPAIEIDPEGRTFAAKSHRKEKRSAHELR